MSVPRSAGPNRAPSRLPALGEAWFQRFNAVADEPTSRRATLGLATLAILSGQGPDRAGRDLWAEGRSKRLGLGDPAAALAALGLPAYAAAIERVPRELLSWASRDLEALDVSSPPEIEALGDVLEATLGASRRSTGSHFTPRDLTRETVARALAPLLDTEHEPITATRCLSLCVCDPAMGGGAFLMEVCRQLARALDAAEGHTGEVRRASLEAIAERCLFGLDRDAIAVEVARISLWLLVRPAEPPLTYAATWVRHGDALVGASRAQLEAFHWSGPGDAAPVVAALVAGRDAEVQRAVGDLLVEAFFSAASPGDRREARDRRLAEVRRWLQSGDATLPASLAAARARARGGLTPFHWELEPRGPFDAFVGNPPFLGGKRISTVHGAAYADWLQAIHETSKNADLAAHFFRRVAGLLAPRGTVSFIATNTISQGDTRTAGLAPLLREGFRIYRAVKSQRWPGAAKVSVSVVHLERGLGTRGAALDGQEVAHVDSRLRARPERPDPAPLPSNEGKGFIGCFLRGDGFILPPTLADDLAARAPASAHLIRPYIGGEEVNTSPTQSFSRYVIDFAEMSLSEAMAHEVLLDALRVRVKPGRDRLRDHGTDAAHKRAWFRFANARPELRAALAPLTRCLVAARVTKHLSFSFQPVSRVFSEQLVVFAFESYARFAVLESRVHEVWARLLSSSLGEGLRYLPSEAFDSFPFPEARHLRPGGALDTLGRRLYEARAERLVEAGIGLTTLKNQLLDRFVADDGTRRLRALYEELDRCVLDAYGLCGVEVPTFAAPLSPADRAPHASFEDAVVEHLYAANRDEGHGGVRPEGV